MRRPGWRRSRGGWEHTRWLDRAHLQEIADSVLHEVKLVAGIGGGVGVDASKYVALKSGLAPTVVSTGAIPPRHPGQVGGHGTVGPSDSWPRTDFQYVVVDYDAVLSAPY